MKFEKATTKDIEQLTELRVAYIQEDLGNVDEADLETMRRVLPEYYSKHLNNDLHVYTARNDDRGIVACAFLLIVEKPASPAFITGKTGTVLNVYTKPECRHKGYAKNLMERMLEDAAKEHLSVVELKATDEGYPLYKAVGFEEVVSKYHVMRVRL
jgi:predicted GNAT family N-acyltransferase